MILEPAPPWSFRAPRRLYLFPGMDDLPQMIQARAMLDFLLFSVILRSAFGDEESRYEILRFAQNDYNEWIFQN